MKDRTRYAADRFRAATFDRIIDFIVRRPLPVLVGIVIVSVLAGAGLPRLHVGTSVDDLVIENLRETARYQAFKQVFESDEIIRIVVKSDNIFSPQTFGTIAGLTEKSSQIKGVRRVISLSDIKKTVDGAQEKSLESFAALIGPVALFQRNLVSDDRRSSVITLVLANEAERDRVIDEVAALLEDLPGTTAAYQIGMPLVSKALADATASDFLRLPPITLAIIVLLLWLLFRNFTCLLLPILVVGLAQIWTFGWMGWTGSSLSMLTMIVPVLLMAVGTAYCLHINAAYAIAYGESGSVPEAVRQTFRKLKMPTLLAVLTTVIGVGALSVNRIEAIREFSFFACFGMVSLLLLMFTLLPAAMSLLPPPASATGAHPSDRLLARFLEKITQVNLTSRRTALAVIGIITLVCLIGIFRIRVETNPVEFFKSGAPVSRHFHDIYKDLSGSFPVNVVMAGNLEDYFEEIDNVKDIAELQAYLETLPGVDKVITFAEYLKLVNYVLNRYDPEYYVLPQEAYDLRMLINNFKTLLGNDTLRRFMTPDFSRTNLLMLTHLSSSREFIEIKNKITAKVGADFSKDLQWDVTGLGVAISASSYHLTSGQIKSLALTMVLVFAMMALLFFSTKVGFIAILPTLFPIVVNFGMMGWLNIPLSMVTSLIASIAVGLSVDDTIHFLFRYNREFKKDLDKDRALKETLMRVGRPIVATTVTIACGFAILMISQFKPTALFGLLMVITMVAALFGSLILLPALMLRVELVTAWDLMRWIPSLGGLPPGIAHELKQPLNAIKVGSAFLMRRSRQAQPIDPDQLARVVNEIKTQTDRASLIIDRLTEFGMETGVEMAPIDLERPIQGTLTLIGSELKLDNIVLRLELHGSLPPITANRQRLSQVFFSLVNNAREAILKKEAQSPSEQTNTITIRTAANHHWVSATITDTGIGIPPEVKARIFEPFFSTNAGKRGRGLGLAVCKQIIKSYGGRIEVESEEECGTVVTLRFPPCEG